MFEKLVGRTIESAQQYKPKEFDDNGFLELRFTDGSVATIVGRYGGYTGKSECEFRTLIEIDWSPIDLERFEPYVEPEEDN